MSLTPKVIFEEKIASRIANNPELAKEVNATYQFNISGENGGKWHISLLANQAGSVKAGNGENANCTISMGDSDLVSLVEGKLNAQMAFMTGKLKVKGDIGLALKLGKVLKV